MFEGKKEFSSPRLITEEITNYLREAIVSERLSEGEKLSEPRLQKMFKTSRSPIREAFSTLEREGLIVRIPRRGAYVSDTGLEELNSTTIVVATLEGLAASLAAPRLTEKDFRKLERLGKKMEQEVKKYAVYEYTDTHNQFHELFVSQCNNKVLIEVIGNLRKRYVRPKVTSYYFKYKIGHAVSSHLQIIDALKRGDPEEAEAVVREHIMKGLIGDERLEEGEVK
ncbi:MAG TPA: GntR family transcriptional regulator [Deltaproteobacteria bacterium]|nr:GntR family transcriptional regulator [Deltaproteobacteria bacterium]